MWQGFADLKKTYLCLKADTPKTLMLVLKQLDGNVGEYILINSCWDTKTIDLRT